MVTAAATAEWWRTWRAALIACMPKPQASPLSGHLSGNEAVLIGERDADDQVYAMQCAAEIADRAHGFRPIDYCPKRA